MRVTARWGDSQRVGQCFNSCMCSISVNSSHPLRHSLLSTLQLDGLVFVVLLQAQSTLVNCHLLMRGEFFSEAALPVIREVAHLVQFVVIWVVTGSNNSFIAVVKILRNLMMRSWENTSDTSGIESSHLKRHRLQGYFDEKPSIHRVGLQFVECRGKRKKFVHIEAMAIKRNITVSCHMQILN